MMMMAQNPEADILRSDLLTNQGDEAMKEKRNQDALNFYTQQAQVNATGAKMRAAHHRDDTWVGLQEPLL